MACQRHSEYSVIRILAPFSKIAVELVNVKEIYYEVREIGNSAPLRQVDKLTWNGRPLECRIHAR